MGAWARGRSKETRARMPGIEWGGAASLKKATIVLVYRFDVPSSTGGGPTLNMVPRLSLMGLAGPMDFVFVRGMRRAPCSTLPGCEII